MLLERTINIPIYYGKLKVTVFDSDDDLLNKHTFGKEWDDRVKYFDGFVAETKELVTGDEFPLFIRPNVKASVIAHEAVHLVNRVFKSRGVHTDYYNDEHYAYFLGWVVREVEKVIDSFKAKQAKNEAKG